MNFANGNPVPLPAGAMKTYGGSAVISDKVTGELLFYTNGRNIWNRNHRLMPNGQDFPASCTNLSSQPALILPIPGRENIFYVFASYFSTAEYGESHPANCITHPGRDYTLTVRCSIVDMQLDNGLGDVVTTHKNILLQQNATEKLTAIPHRNGRDFWLLTHAWNSNAFYIYLITEEGISPPWCSI
ncbi:hypothetical protein [Pontibacter sp. SGAir0037]|uniref:hypothetical protein n=1 Tax=Pontibacter sp. SGAir0037 TaxID=2571030 RepID=UPI0010CD046D|nr:hypothetical protein [Pontibacter sp. SGAir0037]QCR21794.1 hypothetical protein C1N53_05165 [Pontibacter sp. SGAir0037]